MNTNTGSAGPLADPHTGQPIEIAGAPPRVADAAVILLHGRGSTARHMLRLIDEFLHHGVMYLAPQAAHRRWYPRSGYAPVESNEPWLSSALEQVSAALDTAATAGISAEQTLLIGFSQGGCLAAEYVVRTPRRYGGLVVLSGSLLGPEPIQGAEDSIDRTPVFLGCSTDDPYVPAERVDKSAAAFEQLDGDVSKRLYDDLGHEINNDEIHIINQFIGSLV